MSGTPAPQDSISALPELIAELPAEERARVEWIFVVTRSVGELVLPAEMAAWTERSFGSTDAVRRQTVIKTLNRWTLEGALFNDLRARRPMQARTPLPDLEGDGRDPFCNPLTGTPEDVFGRVRGERSLTASNVAKYDGLHSVVIFNRHHPLQWSEAHVVDALGTALDWLGRAHQARPSAIYPFVMWNCLPRSGASILHAHMQVALTEQVPYARVELWRRAAEAYRRATGGDYLTDLFAAHRALGLGWEHGGARWVAHLTPVREKELLLLAEVPGPDLFLAVHMAVRLLADHLAVQAFNMAMYLPPLVGGVAGWEDFPVVVRIVDRGDPGSGTSDVGAMELFGQPVVAADPFAVARRLISLLA